MSTRKPCNNPREAMEVVAQLLGVELTPSLGYGDNFPECSLRLNLADQEATVYVTPERTLVANEGIFVSIGCRVSWPSTTYTAQTAALAAHVHTLAAQYATLVESVSTGRRWREESVRP